jgi:carbonic anhydrase
MFKKLAFALAVCLPFLAVANEEQDAILAELMEGNAAYVAGHGELPPIDAARRSQLVAGQSPKAIVLGCADSRVPPEHLFRQGLGEIFVSRVAGNVPLVGEIASIEYAVEHLHVPVIVVMGHTSCGAVKATLEQVELGAAARSITPALDTLVAEITPAVIEAEEHVEEHGGDLLAEAIEVNAVKAARNLLKRSEVVSHAVSIGEVRLVVAEYDLATGKVRIVKKDVQPVTQH